MQLFWLVIASNKEAIETLWTGFQWNVTIFYVVTFRLLTSISNKNKYCENGLPYIHSPSDECLESSQECQYFGDTNFSLDSK